MARWPRCGIRSAVSGETQALIYNPKTKKVIGINALGVAPTGATPEFFRQKGMQHPPEFGLLAAVTPGTPGGLLVMLAEFGTLSLADVLAPAIDMADGYPIEAQAADAMEAQKAEIKKWSHSKDVFLPHAGQDREAPHAGEIFKQADLAAMLRKLVDAERQALKAGKSRKDAIYAAYDRFYRGDIAQEFVRGSRELGGLHTVEDLDKWKVHVEEPVMTDYKGVQVYKLNAWTQGRRSSNRSIFSRTSTSRRWATTAPVHPRRLPGDELAFADRDFYYGDTYVAPEEPVKGLLSKDYAKARAKEINWTKNDPGVRPGDPHPFQGGTNPFPALLQKWGTPGTDQQALAQEPANRAGTRSFVEGFTAGTTSIQTATRKAGSCPSRQARGPRRSPGAPASA